MARLSVLPLLSLLCVWLWLSGCPAWGHVTFSPNSGTSGASLITAFRVPHGCDTTLASGDAGPKVPTLAITAYLPTALTAAVNPLPGYVPGWPLAINASDVHPASGGAAVSWTWTASDGVGLPLGMFLNFPVSLTLPAVAPGGSVVVQVGVLQQCAFVLSNFWGNTTAGALYPPPHITVTNVSTSSAASSGAPTATSFSYVSLLLGMLLLCVSGLLAC